MLNRFIAVVFVLLCASPFTAPFQTWGPIQSHAAVVFTSPDVNGLASSDVDALTVPPIDTRIGSDNFVRVDARVACTPDAILLETTRRDHPDEHPRFSPPHLLQLDRVVLLRI